jgi:hypothetical protein
MFVAEVRRRAADDGNFLLPGADSVKRPGNLSQTVGTRGTGRFLAVATGACRGRFGSARRTAMGHFDGHGFVKGLAGFGREHFRIGRLALLTELVGQSQKAAGVFSQILGVAHGDPRVRVSTASACARSLRRPRIVDACEI